MMVYEINKTPKAMVLSRNAIDLYARTTIVVIVIKNQKTKLNIILNQALIDFLVFAKGWTVDSTTYN